MILGRTLYRGSMSKASVVTVLISLIVVSASPIATAQIGQPDIVQEH